jgi:hypothetical protein
MKTKKFLIQITCEEGARTRWLKSDDELKDLIRHAAFVVVTQNTTGQIPALTVIKEN